MDFLLIPFIYTALVIFYAPLYSTELAFRRTLLHLCKRSLLRISRNSRYTYNADSVYKTHVVFQHVFPFDTALSSASTATVLMVCPVVSQILLRRS